MRIRRDVFHSFGFGGCSFGWDVVVLLDVLVWRNVLDKLYR